MNGDEEEYEADKAAEDDEDDDDRAWFVRPDDPVWKSTPKREEVNPEDVGETVVSTQSQYRQDKKWGLTKQRTISMEQSDHTYLKTVITPTKAQHDRKLELQEIQALGPFRQCSVPRCDGTIGHLDPIPCCPGCGNLSDKYRDDHDGATPTLDEIADRPRRKKRPKSLAKSTVLRVGEA